MVDDGVSYTLVEERVSDQPIKTQIEQHVLVQGVPSPAGLTGEIQQRYQEAIGRQGFRHHGRATNVYIYVYGSEAQAKAGRGLWLGMLAKGPSDNQPPEVVINEQRLAALSAPSEVRFGLSEPERREAFRALGAAEDRATRDAMAQVPDSQFEKQIELERSLSETYKSTIRQRYDVTEDQLLQLMVEGVEKGWVS